MSKVVNSYDVVVWAKEKLKVEDFQEKENQIKRWLFEDGLINYRGNRGDYFPSEDLNLYPDKFLTEIEVESLIQKHTDYINTDSAKNDYERLDDVFLDRDDLLEDLLKTINLSKLFEKEFENLSVGKLLLTTYLMEENLLYQSVLVIDK